jgi:DNA repair protein RecN (Recombination protein N)
VLEELRITGLGVIDDTTLPLAGGMNVLTGETGAGKTMVVTGLGLLFGGRADAGRVRAEPGRAVVEGRLRLAGQAAEAVHARVAEAGAEVEPDGAVLLSRVVSAEGRSRGHVGGRAVPVAVLARWASRWSRCTASPTSCGCCGRPSSGPRWTAIAGPEHEKLLATYREAYQEWRAASDDLAERRRNAHTRHQEAELLRLGLEEIARVDPQPGEDEELRAEAQRLEHAEGLRAAAATAYQAVGGGDDDTPDAVTLLGGARRTLEAQAAVDQPWPPWPRGWKRPRRTPVTSPRS